MKKAIYTAIIGEYDKFEEPEFINKDFDYFLFTTEDIESEVYKVIKIVKPDDIDNVRFARRIKILPHIYLKDYDITIWHDGNIIQKNDISELMDHFNGNFAVVEHPIRHCVYEEADACIELEKDDEEIIMKQMDKYRKDNYPEDQGMVSSNVLIRKNTKEVNEFCEKWFDEVLHCSRRDQLSFNYIKYKYPIDVNIMPYYIVFEKIFKLNKHIIHIEDKKILIATVTYEGKDYAWDRYYKHIKEIDCPNCDYLVIDNSETYTYYKKLKARGVDNVIWAFRGINTIEALANSYQILWEYVIENDYDYVLTVESDLFVPKDILRKLIAHNKLIVGSPYYLGEDQEVLCFQHSVGDKLALMKPEVSNKMLNTGLQQIKGVGFGCTLFHKAIMKFIPIRIRKHDRVHHDSLFYIDCNNKGVPVYVDTDIKPIPHDAPNWIKERKRLGSY